MAIYLGLGSLMDKTVDSGSTDAGSIPVRDTKYQKGTFRSKPNPQSSGVSPYLKQQNSYGYCCFLFIQSKEIWQLCRTFGVKSVVASLNIVVIFEKKGYTYLMSFRMLWSIEGEKLENISGEVSTKDIHPYIYGRLQT